jgi:cobalt-zinc-cadmium efflux system protein
LYDSTKSSETDLKIKKLKIVLILTSSYLIAEVLTGYFSGSLALFADAGHMFTDSFGIGLALFAVTYSRRLATPQHTFGFYRTEILASLANCTILLLISILIIYEAYRRILEPLEIQTIPMIVVAVIGLIVNVAGLLFLKNEHSHDHGTSSSNHEEIDHQNEKKQDDKVEDLNFQSKIKNFITRKKDKRKQDDKVEDLNLQGARLELLSDTIGSIGLIAGGLLIYLTNFQIIDPILSIGLAILIVPRTLSLMKKSVNVLMEGTPSNLSYEKIQRAILQIKGVTGVFELHIWCITSGNNALSAHVVIIDTDKTFNVLNDINSLLEKRFKISHTTIQIEGYHEVKDQ